MTIVEVLKLSADYLTKHGSDSARLDAEVLLAHALGMRRLDLYLKFDRALGEPELAAYRALVARRGKGEPVAYLVGHKEFMGLDFEVTPDVLVPNPDTEVLVQRAVEIARESPGAVRVADVGTGSGCIAIAIAHYAGNVEVVATEVSADALAVARRNVAKHGLEGRVHLREADMLSGVDGTFDVVCANLPYVAAGARLPAEVTAQPPAALYAGDGGAALVRRLLAEAPAHLKPGGRILAEVDESFVSRLESPNSRIHRDLGGRARVLEICS